MFFGLKNSFKGWSSYILTFYSDCDSSVARRIRLYVRTGRPEGRGSLADVASSIVDRYPVDPQSVAQLPEVWIAFLHPLDHVGRGLGEYVAFDDQ